MRARNASICAVVGGLHRALELRLVGLERVELRVDERRDVLDVIGHVGLPQQHRVRSVVRDPVLLEEVRIACGDHGVAREQSGVAVIGVQAITLPRIVAEHDLRAQLSDDLRDRATQRERAVEFAVDLAEEHHLTGRAARETSSSLALFVLPAADERSGVGRDVPGALRAVGADEVVHDAPGGRPLGERATGAELDVVGMRADRQRRPSAPRGRG